MRRDCPISPSMTSLTGLPNRRCLPNVFPGLGRPSGTTSMALLFLDMDYFKNINDSWGI